MTVFSVVRRTERWGGVGCQVEPMAGLKPHLEVIPSAGCRRSIRRWHRIVVGGAEPEGFPLVNGAGRVGGIDFHVANGAEPVRVGGNAEFGVFDVGIGIEPAATLIFQVEGGLGGGG